MQKWFFRFFFRPDFFIALLLLTGFLGLASLCQLWVAKYQPVIAIDLSLWRLPYYTLLSAMRAGLAYVLSFFFTLVVGYAAAKSATAERFIIPLLDILQSIPVLGFLPGILLALVACFPNSNLGIELSAILCIFTSQVWNLTFCFYASLKSIPIDLEENARILNLSRKEKLFNLELPFSAVALAWNSVLSMAGGWFFLVACEAFSLGEKKFRIPGLGSYLDEALRQADYFCAGSALLAMASLIFFLDFILWRPVLVWVQKFSSLPQPVDPVMLSWMKHSHIIKSLSWAYDQFFFRPLGRFLNSFDKIRLPWSAFPFQKWQKPFGIFFFLMLFFVFYQNLFHLFFFFGSIPLLSWWVFFQHGLLSLFRILLALILATLLCVPLSVWLGVKPSRMRAARPILQLCASFPGSMLYVIFAVGLQAWGVSFHVTCVLLLFIGMQWYVLFNALGGVSQISSDLNAVLCMTKASYWATWKMLFIPSLLPSLMTGWITAMGAGWNALVLAEFLEFQKTLFFTPGLGSDIRKALAENDTQAFLASLLMMIFLILLMNRFFWTPLYRFVLNRYQYN